MNKNESLNNSLAKLNKKQAKLNKSIARINNRGTRLNRLNFDLLLELSNYLHDNYIFAWIKLWKLNKNLYPLYLYTLRKHRQLNNMVFDFSFPTYFDTIVNNNLYNNLTFFSKLGLIPLNNYSKFIESAAKKGYLRIIKILYQHHNNKNFSRYINIAADNNNLEIVKYLILINSKLTTKTYDYSKIINTLAEDGNMNMVKTLVPIHKDEDDSYRFMSNGTIGNKDLWYAIYNAAKYKDLETIKFLAPLSTNKNFSSAIYYAADHGYTEIVKYLAPLSDNKNFSRNIMSAVYGRYIEIIKILAPLSTNKTFNDAIHIANHKGYTEIVEYLES